MRMSPEIAIFILFRRCLRPQARFGAQPPLAAALGAEMRRNSARLVSRYRKFFDTLRILKLSKSFKILLIERAVGFLPTAHTPRCSVPDIFCEVF